MNLGWDGQPKKLIELSQRETKYIIEGVQGYRTLRKGLTEKSYKPDIIIKVMTNRQVEKKHETIRKALDTIYLDCQDMVRKGSIPVINYIN